MTLQHTTTNKMLPLLPGSAPCDIAPGRFVQSGLYESKMLNDKKYWPGLYRT